MKPMNSGAKTYMGTPIKDMTTIPIPTVMWTKLRANAFRAAPMLWPKRVVAASDIPKPGI